MAESRYRPQLDSLRALAVAIVMIHHYRDHPFFLSGFGVTLFFVLSGFFATRLLLRLKTQIASRETTSSAALAEFYVGRYLRIFPLYYLVLLVTAICNLPYARSMLPWNGLFLSNFATWWTGEWPGRFSHFWSLATLEQYYIFWPLLILACPRKRMLHLIFAFIAVGPIFRIVCLLFDFDPITWCVSPFASFDQLGCGALLAFCQAEKIASPLLRQRVLFVGGWICGPLFFALVAGKAFDIDVPGSTIYITLFASFFFIWLIERSFIGFTGIVGKVLDSPALARIGTMSYSIYLLHTFSQFLLPRPPVVRHILASDWRMLVLIPGTLFFAYLSWRFLETPLRYFRKALLVQISESMNARARTAALAQEEAA